MTGFGVKLAAIATLAAGLLLALPGATQVQPAPPEHWRWGTSAEVQDKYQLIETLRQRVFVRNFPALDSLDAQYRRDGATTASGVPLQSLYYQIVTSEIGNLQQPDGCKPLWQPYLAQWRAASPHSPAPIILAASLMEGQAWCYRGNGTGGEVAESSWQPFRQTVRAAIALLEQNKAIASVDPEYYSAMESLYVADQRPRAQFQKLLDEASARYPYYYDIYFQAERYYQPQWYGSLADIDRVARYAAAKTKARDGTSAYARVYWHTTLCGCYGDLDAMDWPTMRTAMADLADRHPDDWTFLHLVQMSCLRGQGDEARKYFGKMAVNQAANWTQQSWAQCRALVGPSPVPVPTS